MSTKNRSEMGLAGETVALVLAGGNGTRLGELTRWQCKPAISFGGHFRNIDFTLSNCVNSGVRRIAVLTQYKAQSLINHIGAGWNFLARPLGEFVDVWPAQQRLHHSWYAGTADAVHQNLDLLLAHGSRYTLVLAGDHVYKMNYRRLLEQHVGSGADVTVACVPVPLEESAAFGVLGIDEQQRVCSFIEKPQPASLGSTGQRTVMASMGVYVFSTNTVLAGNVHVAEGTLLDEAVVLPGARIGANCKLRRVIIDAGVEIPDGTLAGWQPAGSVESMRTGGRITLLSRNGLPPADDEFRSVA